MDVAPADGITFDEFRHFGTDFFDDAGSFVAEAYVGVLVVFIGTAEAGVGDFDEDLAAFDVFCCG